MFITIDPNFILCFFWGLEIKTDQNLKCRNVWKKGEKYAEFAFRYGRRFSPTKSDQLLVDRAKRPVSPSLTLAHPRSPSLTLAQLRSGRRRSPSRSRPARWAWSGFSPPSFFPSEKTKKKSLSCFRSSRFLSLPPHPGPLCLPPRLPSFPATNPIEQP